MSTVTIPTRADEDTIDQTWFNVLQAALGVDFVPRNSSGVATDAAGSLGTNSYRWLNAYIKALYLYSSTTGNKITLSVATAIAANYNITLPAALPLTNMPLSVDNTGVASFGTIDAIGSLTARASGVALGNISISASSSNYFTTNSAFQTVLTQALTTRGGPVTINFVHDGSANNGGFIGNTGIMAVFDGATQLSQCILAANFIGGGAYSHTFIPAAGAHTFYLKVRDYASGTTQVLYQKMVIYEMS